MYIYSLDCARKLRSKGSLLQLRLTHFELQILHMNINHIALIQKIASVQHQISIFFPLQYWFFSHFIIEKAMEDLNRNKTKES